MNGKKSEEEKVVLNQEAIQICPVCGEHSVVVRYGELSQATKMFCLECGRFWIESEGIKNEDPRAYIDWKIRELDEKVQERVEDVKSKLIKNPYVIHFQDSEGPWWLDESTRVKTTAKEEGKEGVKCAPTIEDLKWNDIIEEKRKQLDDEVEDIVEDAIKTVNTACFLSGIPCDPDTSDGIQYIERCLDKMKKGEKI